MMADVKDHLICDAATRHLTTTDDMAKELIKGKMNGDNIQKAYLVGAECSHHHFLCGGKFGTLPWIICPFQILSIQSLCVFSDHPPTFLNSQVTMGH